MNITKTLLAILDEAFDRPPTPWAYFTNGDGQSGYFGTLDKIDFHDAGRAIAGNSIAAQIQHVTFVICVANESISGNADAPDAPDAEQWRQSWSIDNLDSKTWNRMRHNLRTGYADLRQSVVDTSINDDDTFAKIVGVIAHVAYHLGAIRCKAQAIEQTQPENIE